ncbi:hypothetical protein N7448_002879 [Penicillium atrosanguineum]|uniref:Uncharacterized protein n=1 Tax=Penicillium atrosanguineum TaxID=1132637 RepID=A0A9W9PV00_9EURO|nr:hypothetical protein N7526_008684 [Penicillium atrosanguineum]KAJ5139471.1 hypothetical protein N7448_002879 [Penicillium atrosanguineum]KAJ5314911.1 hypothetical protein N7476_005218 [Penicillium atrosanguineum]
MVTGKSQPGLEPVHFPASPEPVPSNSPPSRRDLASWWRQFKRNTRKDDLKAEAPRGIFGVPLNVSIKYANVAISLTNERGESFIYGYVPIVVAKCGVFLKEKATDVEGIFRLNGSAKRIKDLQEIFDSPERYGKGLDWSGYTVHDAANVLRRYLNQLPEPIVPLEFYERFREPLRIYQEQVLQDNQVVDADKFDHAKAVDTYQRLIIELPPLNKQLLLYILDLLAVFASKSDQNRMTSANLSAIFQPGMLSHPQHDMAPAEYKLSQDVLIFLIENQDHFLVGMSGTCADEQQVKEVEAGIPSRPTTTQSNVRRSVSSASASTESQRKLDSIRRNVSVSSRNSRTSNNAPSPGTPTSTGVGVHRSNTLPSKMGPVVAARFARSGETASNNPSGLSVSHQSSRSASRTPSVREEPEQRNPSIAPSTSTIGSAYVHTSTHGPIPVAAAEALNIGDTPRPQEYLHTPVSQPPQTVTPSRERKISTLFTKSPPPESEQKEPRQPNRLRKKRIPGSASISAQSSSTSLHATPSELYVADPSLEPRRGRESIDIAMGDITPKPPTSANMSNLDAPSDSHAIGEGTSQLNHDTSLKPHQSRTPSMNSRSSFTDHSDYDQAEDTARSERRDNRRSWRFQRSSKRSSEQVGLGLASPPLAATYIGADQSTSSIGSGKHSTDPSSQPLSLDAGIQSGSSQSAEPEKKSLFGKFKAKVAQVRDGVKDERERAKSPNQSDFDTYSSQPLSPTVTSQTNGKPTLETPTEPPKEEPVRSPVSPLPGAGMPPSIPEEPHSPEAPVHVPAVESKEVMQEKPTSTLEAVPVPEIPMSEAPKQAAEKEASA